MDGTGNKSIWRNNSEPTSQAVGLFEKNMKKIWLILSSL